MSWLLTQKGLANAYQACSKLGCPEAGRKLQYIGVFHFDLLPSELPKQQPTTAWVRCCNPFQIEPALCEPGEDIPWTLCAGFKGMILDLVRLGCKCATGVPFLGKHGYALKQASWLRVSMDVATSAGISSMASIFFGYLDIYRCGSVCQSSHTLW